MRGPAENWSERAELLRFRVPGIRSRNLTPFSNAVPVLGLKSGPDFRTVFVTDRARIFVSAPANPEAGTGWDVWDGLGWDGWGCKMRASKLV